MILESVLSNIVEQQKQRLSVHDSGLKRELVPALQNLPSHALIISGVRRCGKSTLLLQIMEKLPQEDFLYLNFEMPRLYNFDISDFTRLDNIITKKGTKTLFFDEIQYVDAWELYVRQKLDEGYRVIITGSNASLMSKELGTKLTGRHISQELFPFSFSEFLKFKELKASAESLEKYLTTGGFPEYLKTQYEEQLSTLFDDILFRDIVARFGIKDIKSLQRLAVYLYSNIGNRITATKLKQILSIGATSTILSWFSHFELSYLVFFLPMFSHSTKAQLINPRKVYAIDLGLINIVSNKLTGDKGHKLENLVYLHLRKKYKELYYFDENGECDFVAMKNAKVKELIQVSYQLTPDNLEREIGGLKKAMQFFKLNKGVIITLNDKDSFMEQGLEIEVIPAFEYLLQ
ncbi:MAG: ATP-binding protein [bacterium]|nr:MAG: ATP-binding protein [bacterium]